MRPEDAYDAVESYGDQGAELEAIEQGSALLDETDRGAVRVLGPDAVDFLQRLLANDVRNLLVGDVRRNLLLTAKGRVLHLFELVRLAEHELLAITAPGAGAALYAALEKYHFGEQCELTDDTPLHAPLALLGPRAADVLGQVVIGGELPGEGRATTLDHGGSPALVVRRRRHGAPGFLIDVGPVRAEHLWDALLEAGARPAGRLARETRRIAAGEPLAGVDVDDTRYPQEARLDDAFSLAKGCYVGQEVVTKIDTYGGLHRRLVILELDGAEPPPPGSELLAGEAGGGTPVGQVTSSAARPGGGALALGFVKLEHETPGTRLLVGDGGHGARVVAPAGT